MNAEENIWNIIKQLKTFSYEEFETQLRKIPDCIQSAEIIEQIFEGPWLEQTFNYYIYDP